MASGLTIGDWTRELYRRCYPGLEAIPGGGSGWVAVDLAAAVKTDANTIYNPTGSSLGLTSTIVLNNAHGRIDGAMDSLSFTVPIVSFVRTVHFGVAVRAAWTNTIAGGTAWELYLGCGNDAAPVANQGVYISSQLDSSAATGGHDYGAAPITSQSVTDARYLAGVIHYRSDRQQGGMGQVATSDRTSRGGGERTTDPGVAMAADDQHLLVGIGNNSASSTGTLTGLQVAYQLLAHHGT